MDKAEIIETVGDTSMVRLEHSATEMSMTDLAGWMSHEFGVGISQVLQSAAFMLCCDVIAQDMAKSTLRLRERLPNNTSRVVMPTKHEMAAFLALEPNARHTWYECIEMMVLWKCLTQNAYAGVLRTLDGTVTELIPFQTGRVMEKIEGRDTFYDVTAATQQEQALLGALSRTFAERDFLHVRGRLLDGMDGYSTMLVGRSVLDTTRQLEKFRNSLFSEEGQIRGVFQREKEGSLDEQAFQRLRSQFKILMTKFRQMTEPIVLEDGLRFEAISSKPSDLELSKQFEAQINDVCRLLRMPPHKVFLLANVKYENLDTMEKAYVGDTLVPIAIQFEQRLGRALLQRNDRLKLFFEFDRSEMTLRDTKAETDRIMRGAERGLFLHDEARAMLGSNPLPNGAGQVRTIPANSIVLDAKNKVLVGLKTPATDTPAEDAPAEDETTEPAKGIRLVASN